MQTVIALGTFDGMHLGHRTVIARAVEEAERTDARAIVYTFSSIPRALFSKAPLMLMTPEERKKEILNMGVSEVVMVDFTEEILNMTPEAFVKMLKDSYDPKCIVAGEDYTFGYRARGNMDLMKKLGQEMEFSVITVPPVRVVLSNGALGDKISSTDIRKAILENKQEIAKQLANGKYE